MLAVLAAVVFLLVAILTYLAAISPPGAIGFVALGLALLALHLVWPWSPWTRAHA